MKIFFTGGAGFIGSHLADRLVSEGHELFILDDLSNGRFENIKPILNKICFLQGTISHLQIRDVPFVPDMIIHFAALGSAPRSIERPIDTFNANVKGTQLIFEAARVWKCQRVIYASSSSVYGSKGHGHRTEQSPPDPISPYAVSKRYAEILAKSYSECFGIKSLGLRFFNVFGPRQRLDSPYSAVIPKFCKSIMDEKKVHIYGDGLQTRTFTPVEFVVDCVNEVVNRFDGFETDIFNVTDASYALDVNQLAQKIIEHSGHADVTIERHPKRNGDVNTSIGYGQYLFDKIGARRIRDLDQAIKSTCDWYFKKQF